MKANEKLVLDMIRAVEERDEARPEGHDNRGPAHSKRASSSSGMP